MKKVNLLLLASLSISQVALAANLTCEVTRTNKLNEDDVATHTGINKYFDPSAPNGRTLVSGKVNSFLIPGGAIVRYAFQTTGRLQTRLAMETVNAENGQQVVYAEQLGSVASTPEPVFNDFDAGNYRYNVQCSIQDDSQYEDDSFDH